ncbi:MAG: hypothetical protein EBR48_02605 [bacterium]|nr:hypothetical protein [Candidatus Aquidulcis frankliniae]
MTTVRDKSKPLREQEQPTDLNRRGVALQPEVDRNQLEPRPAADWLAVFGVGSAMVAFLMWAIPANCFRDFGGWYCSDLFSDERQTAIAVFLAFSLIALLLRRR